MRAYLSLLPVLLILVSCSGKGPSNASFKLEVSNQGISSSGGLVIFGKEAKGGQFARIVSSTSVTVEIPKGSWTFGAIAWDGSNGPMTGVVICASQSGVAVSSDSTTVNLKLTNAHCFTSAFSTEAGDPDGPNLRASLLQPEFCESDITGLSTSCVYDPTAPNLVPKRGFIGSFRMSIPGASGEVLETPCFLPHTGQDTTFTYNLSDVNIPAFLTSLGLPLYVDAYLGAECEPTKGKFHLSFNDSAQARLYDTGVTNKSMFARTPLASVCSMSDMLGTTDFAAGNGDAAYPWVICNAVQLAHLQSEAGDSILRNHSYILGRDINLLSIISGQYAAADPCLDGGDTLAPIGKYFDGSCNLLDHPTFNGDFDGNGFAVNYFRFKKSDSHNIGLFSKTNGNITNLKMSGVSIEGKDFTGSAAGQVLSGGFIQNIHITDADIRGDDGVGGVTGDYAGITSINSFSVVDSVVEGLSNLGGVVGSISSANIDYAEFDGQVMTNSQNSSIGGIVGTTGGEVRRSVSSGTIRGNGSSFGGISGQAVGALYTRSDMVIIDHSTDTSTTRNFGGILGVGGTINSSLFTGNILSACTGSTCKIGGVRGDNTGGTPIDSYSVFQPGGLNGTNGNTALMTDLFTNSNVKSGLCTTFAGSCEWTYNLKDLPRLTALDDDHFCANALNNDSLANQTGRGSSPANPYIICNPDQLYEVDSYPGKYFSIRQNLSLVGILANTIGPFNGYLNGNGHILHSHFRNSSTSMGLFSTVTGEIKDLFLAGTKFEGYTCGSCNAGALAMTNGGTISNVHVTGAKIFTNDLTMKVGGIVAVNSGTIEYSSFNGDLKGPTNVGGIVSENTGTVRNNRSHPYMDYSDPTITQWGGVVAVNKGDVLRNTFRGDMKVFSSTSSSRIGGIVGYVNRVTVVPKVVDNDVSSRSYIQVANNTTNSGAVVGESNDASNIISRNVQKSLFLDPNQQASVRSIVGSADGTFSNNGDSNFSLSTTFVLVSASVGTSASAYTSPVCQITVDTGIGFSGTHGAFKIFNQYYYGTLSGSTTNFTLNINTDSSRCTSFNGIASGQINVYRALEVPDAPTFTDFKDNNFEILDMTDPDDIAIVYAAYISQITTGIPATSPVWLFEPGEEEGVKLFNSND